MASNYRLWMLNTGLELRKSLGRMNVFFRNQQVSFSQQGDFVEPHIASGLVFVRSPDPTIGSGGRLRRQSLVGTSLYSGVVGPVNHIVIVLGESTGAGATADGGGVSDPVGSITNVAPLPGVLECFNGGPMPHQFGASKGLGAHTTPIDPAQIASLVDAHLPINAQNVGRESQETPLGETIATMVRPGDKVTIVNRSVGSCNQADLYGTVGSPAVPFVDVKTMVSKIVTLRPTYTNIVCLFVWAGSTEDNFLGAIANYQTVAANVRALVDTLKALTGQTKNIVIAQPQIQPPRRDGIHESSANAGTVDPATGKDPNTGIKAMGTVTQMALGPLYNVLNAVDANFITRPRYYGHKGGTTDVGDAVHYQSSLYSMWGGDVGVLYGLFMNGFDVTPLHVVPGSVTRRTNSKIVNFTLSRSAVVDQSKGFSPGNYGLSYYTAGTNQTIDAVSIVGTAGTLTLHSLPSTSNQEYMCAGFDNATEVLAPILETIPSGDPGFPDGLQGAYGNGYTNGTRTEIKGLVPFGYRPRDGGAVEDWLAHDRQASRVSASTGGFKAALTEANLSAPDWLMDFRDTNCVAANNSQALLNLEAAATSDFYRGSAVGSGADDPSIFGWVAAPGALNRSMGLLFNGSQFCTPQATTTVLVNAHKAGQQFTLFAMGRYRSNGANPQVILATCQTSGGGAAQGVFLNFAANGKPQAGVKGAANAVVVTINAVTAYVDGDYYVIMVCLKDGVQGWMWTDKDGFMVNTGNALNWTSPSALARQSDINIGRGGSTGPSSTRLPANSEVHVVAAWDQAFAPGTNGSKFTSTFIPCTYQPLLNTAYDSQIANVI